MENNTSIRNAVLESVRGLSDQQLNERVSEGTWTVMQVLHHLYLMERVITHSISKQLDNEESTETTEKPIHLTPDRSRKVDAPAHVIPSEKFMTLKEIEEMLRQSRHDFNQLAEGIDEDVLLKKSFLHPLFGSLSLKQWIPFVGLHEKRHLEQIEEIKKQLLASH